MLVYHKLHLHFFPIENVSSSSGSTCPKQSHLSEVVHLWCQMCSVIDVISYFLACKHSSNSSPRCLMGLRSDCCLLPYIQVSYVRHWKDSERGTWSFELENVRIPLYTAVINWNGSVSHSPSLSLLQGPRCNNSNRYNLWLSRRDGGRLQRNYRPGEMLSIPQSLHQSVLPQTWDTSRQDGSSASTCGQCTQGDNTVIHFNHSNVRHHFSIIISMGGLYPFTFVYILYISY